ncbi:hypothetical protein [Streptomyces lancefieldiae]|uniref:Lipoprotein n=1 Tax=Streptomyces lancefieldiae TaxID=3075520 RepID=A0ABU3AKT3_9ACTN|nr:hypothetical protein [Streptomyces sp. DSM 40712]MDT0610792.1 hypothetical protein [Streptomyces sp. DSM 40712]
MTAAFALTLLTAVAAAGCGNPGDGEAGSGTPRGASAPPTSPRPPSAAELCVRAVGYWARDMLDGKDTYGDYQSMGLSNRQYDILREVVDAARATNRDQGAGAAERLIDRQVREACAERYRDGAPSTGPWQR